MESLVCFRDFEERDIDFIYKCKNNEKLWRHTVGEHHNFSYGEAVEWVHGCMQDDPTYKFWAICKNDDTKDIIGWCSISKIDFEKKTAKAHGIVIGNKEYNDGFTWIESMLYILNYVFEVLQFDELSTQWFTNHPSSHLLMAYSDYFATKKTTVDSKGEKRSIEAITINKKNYIILKENNMTKIDNIIKNIVAFSKKNDSLRVLCK